MFYNLITHLKDRKAIIRPSADGLSDLEFQLGCRIHAQMNSKETLIRIAYDQPIDLDLLEPMEWADFLRGDETGDNKTIPDLHPLRKRSQPVCTEYYNRGPYARSR